MQAKTYRNVTSSEENDHEVFEDSAYDAYIEAENREREAAGCTSFQNDPMNRYVGFTPDCHCIVCEAN